MLERPMCLGSIMHVDGQDVSVQADAASTVLTPIRNSHA